jgi:hypothetical protein
MNEEKCNFFKVKLVLVSYEYVYCMLKLLTWEQEELSSLALGC